MPLTTIAKLLQEARHVVVFTGAGVSAESGIPTFRDVLTGLWSRFDPAQLATAEAFRADPQLCWGWYEWRRLQVLQAQPNAAHLAIAELAKHVPRLTVVTQNVDDLHERAGSQDVTHLHGSLHSPRCIDCGNAHLTALPSDDLPLDGCRLEPPRCIGCNGYIRPGVVWFGEMLPEAAWNAGFAASGACDLFFSVGTSGVVFPAAELPLRALGAGAKVIHVNHARVEVCSQELWLQGSAAGMMKTLFEQAFG
ncbi:SIR2 family NAD-dependent protein deacylase [Pseudomonas monteilii]|uniref:SIR2 family NAD-dependent protein deacylase n=1 Tax=Pseudomonas monteilii TaxID=76759 RepID=UPI0015FBB66D|nr:NAD-dependent deacylase [Pseudomonas monteilii]MBA6106040.1 NAD-dependent deacylase [Pseudomonas monteilii]MCE0877437.1 NAD-dependent deacylase [Pseudomonas monteilii]MCE0929490.1 NAD-dependent deacylase [Pseudomonas monteilii]MCE1015650.1 NAD-dependent deacylase [Pseudomonas monteilii]MCE1044532.1 NAD-dependent deacylase [Pseudomonas monteilii]